jgi:hypothetical protein
MRHTILALALAPALLGAAGRDEAPFQVVPHDKWCDHEGEWSRDRAHHCEVRESTWPATGRLRVDASPNGGIEARGWSRSEVELLAKVVAVAETEGEARDLAAAVRIEKAETIRATGPDPTHRRHWWVSYRLSVPEDTELSLHSTNGGISAESLRGVLDFETRNGGISLEDVSGRVRGRTTNGGVDVRLLGAGWKGDGLDVVTTNGGVRLSLPASYDARVETGTTNGSLSVDFPVTLQGRIDRKHLAFDVGRGGAPLRVLTTNGGVEVVKR